jgi:hypothetical protein
MKTSAIFIQDPKSKRETLLGKLEQEVAIGKSPEASVKINDLRCAGIHALIERNPKTNEITVTDLGSHFGTYIKGKRVSSAKLKQGEVFVIGRHHLLVRDVNESALKSEPGDFYREGRAPLVRTTTTRVEKGPIFEKIPKGLLGDPDKQILQASLFWGDQILESKIFSTGQNITVGSQRDATFCVTFNDPNRDAKSDLAADPDQEMRAFTIGRYEKTRLLLHVPPEATGIVWIGQEMYSIDHLRHKDKSTSEFGDLKLQLKVGDRADIQFGELTLSFRFVAPADPISRALVPEIEKSSFIIGLAMTGLFFLTAFMLSQMEVQVKETTLDDVAPELKRAVYDAGILNAIKRRHAAIGELSRSLDGGRAKGEQGKMSPKKDPEPKAAPKEEPKQVADKKSANSKSSSTKQTQIKAPQPQGESARSNVAGNVGAQKAAEPAVDMDAAFGIASKTPGHTVGATQGTATNGNSVAAITDGGSYGSARTGKGTGGGGKSVGIGQLSGNSVGGGQGAGDYGITPAKGREIKAADTEELVILGGLDRDVITQIIKRYLHQIQYCYEQQLVTKPSLKGKVLVAFVISGTGSIASAEIAETSLNDTPAERCILSKVATWKFPKPRGGGTVGVRYPFLLQSSSSQ